MDFMGETSVEVAKGITNFGMMAITAAFFLVFAGTMLVIFVKWFVHLINGIVDTQRQTNKDLLCETRDMNEKLEDIRGGLMEETMTRIRVVSSLAFDLAAEETCRMVRKVKEENHIEDEAGTTEKIRRLVQNLHEDRNSKFDSFSFRGRRLSAFTLARWIDDVAEAVRKEVYCDDNPERTFTNIGVVYGNIKLEFYSNLKEKL